jgi:hypothetical protein
VHADLPYAHPGETVALDALGVDPKGRTLTWGWATCDNPADSSATGCLEELRAARASGKDVRLTTGVDATTFSVDIGDDALSALPASAREHATVGVLAVACPGVLEPTITATTSVADPLPVICRDADSGKRLGPFDYIVGMKRLFVRESDRNANPEIGRILWDGKPWDQADVPSVVACDKDTNSPSDCPEAVRHRVSIEPAKESFEHGIDEDGQAFDEQLVVQYYADQGAFADDVRIATDPETKWVARASSRGKDAQFWLVARDNRGGVVWAERTVHVKP